VCSSAQMSHITDHAICVSLSNTVNFKTTKSKKTHSQICSF